MKKLTLIALMVGLILVGGEGLGQPISGGGGGNGISLSCSSGQSPYYNGSAWVCAAAPTYTEPATNLPICRTGAGTVGRCTNLTDVAGGTPALDAVTDPTGAKTFTLLDNNASALSFGTTGKADILKIVTTDAAEGVTMSGTLGVTGAVTGASLSTPQAATPDYMQLRPGTGATNPTYYRGWLGPAQPVTSLHYYQLPDAAPAPGQVMQFGAVSGGSSPVTFSTLRWSSGSRVMLLPTASDDYPNFRCFTSRTLTDATLLVVGGTSVAATLYKCNNTLSNCATAGYGAISDSLTVNAAAEGTFLGVGGGALSVALVAGDRIKVDVTAVTGVVTYVTLDLGGTIP